MGNGDVLILGGQGMLGSDLAAECQRQGIASKVLDLPGFDITDNEQLAANVRRAGAVVNCAAYTDVDKAEREFDTAYSVNAEAVGRLGELAGQAGLWVLHISTDFVFDGTGDRPYLETDTPNPVNTYGRSKLAGEQLLAESGCRFCILRIQWTYGRAGSNFVTRLVSKARSGRDLSVVDDQVGSPTATAEVAKVICELLRKRPQGLFHFAASGYVSRFGMAGFIFEKLGISVGLNRCRTSDYPAAAVRPLNSRFDCRKIVSLLNQPIRRWQMPLERFLRQL